MQRRRSASCLCGLLLLAGIAHADMLTGRVVGISDGDTITVLDAGNKQHKIRIAGIDSPEKAQPFGKRAKQYMSDLLYRQAVEVNWRKYDRYGRIVGKVMIAPPNACPAVQPDCPKTLDAGLAQITVGQAWHYKQYAKEQSPDDRERYAMAEQQARAKHAGLWHDKNPVPPWEWRAAKRGRRN